ncbi:MAG TPA: hypothetical protein VII12_17155 [Thermoanaerobaculia bacterium]
MQLPHPPGGRLAAGGGRVGDDGGRHAIACGVPRWLILIILPLAACSHKTAEQKLLEDVDPTASWVATLQLAGEKWLANSVPTSFVRGCVGGAEKEFDKTSKTIGKSPARRNLRDEISAQIEIARAAAGHLKEAVEKNDRLAVADSVKRFAASSAALHRLEQQKDPP